MFFSSANSISFFFIIFSSKTLLLGKSTTLAHRIQPRQICNLGSSNSTHHPWHCNNPRILKSFHQLWQLLWLVLWNYADFQDKVCWFFFTTIIWGYPRGVGTGSVTYYLWTFLSIFVINGCWCWNPVRARNHGTQISMFCASGIIGMFFGCDALLNFFWKQVFRFTTFAATVVSHGKKKRVVPQLITLASKMICYNGNGMLLILKSSFQMSFSSKATHLKLRTTLATQISTQALHGTNSSRQWMKLVSWHPYICSFL